jgi:hypothetical protein
MFLKSLLDSNQAFMNGKGAVSLCRNPYVIIYYEPRFDDAEKKLYLYLYEGV